METPETITSMDKVAQLAGLSRATISDIVNDRWEKKGISRKTFDRVTKLMEQHNYRPNALARGLAFGKTFNIGVQLPSASNEHWSNVHRFLDQALRKRNYHMTLASPTVFHLDEASEIRHLCDRQVDGLILSPTRGRRLLSLFNWLKDRRMPFVFLGDAPMPGHFSVVDDNKAQARMAVEHLIRLGHTRIAYLHGSPGGSKGERDRCRGYLETMREYGLPVSRRYMRMGHYSHDRSIQAIQEMMKLPVPPTAIYCTADEMALGVLAGAAAMGIRVPDDLAVVGHADDIPYIEHHRIPLTTIRQPRQHLAEFAAWMLLDVIDKRTPMQPTICLPGELIVRESCGGKAIHASR